MNKEIKQQLESIAKKREAAILALYQEFAEQVAPIVGQLVMLIFKKFPELEKVKWDQSPQYNDENYVYGLGSMSFCPEPEDWYKRDEMREAFSEVLEEYELEKLLAKTLGNVNITLSREGIEVSAIADDSEWTERY